MHDWHRYARDHLPVGDLKVQRALDLVDELASQMEDVYRTALSHGASEPEADAQSGVLLGQPEHQWRIARWAARRAASSA